MYQIKLDQFEGPLDLLLRLIEKEKLDITKISLVQVTDAYLAHLQKIEVSPQELADFLVIAAKLLLIKSGYLIPSVELEEESKDLTLRLRFYREYFEATKILKKILKKKSIAFSREEKVIPGFYLKTKIRPGKLYSVFCEIIKKISFTISLKKKTVKKLLPLKQKIKFLLSLIKEKEIFNFYEVISFSSREEVIVSFLAILHLAKRQIISLEQKTLFAEILVKKLKNA